MTNRFDIVTKEVKKQPLVDSQIFGTQTSTATVLPREAGTLASIERFRQENPFGVQATERVSAELAEKTGGVDVVGIGLGFVGGTDIRKVSGAVKAADTALSRLISVVKSAKPVRKEIEAAQSAERAVRAGRAAGILESAEGERAFIQAKGQLKGELVPDKPRFESLRTIPKAPVLSKELEPLAQEARKYKSAEEFAQSIEIREINKLGERGLKSRAVFSGDNRVSPFFKTSDEARKWLQSNVVNPTPRMTDIGERIAAQRELSVVTSGRLLKNPDGTITVYHGTSQINADRILQDGQVNAGTFFSPSKSGTKFGDSPLDVAKRKFGKEGTVVEIKVDPRDVGTAAAGSELFVEKQLVRGADGIWRAIDREIPQKQTQLTDFYNQAVRRVEEIGEKLGQGDIDTLFIQIQRHPDLTTFEKISAADGFSQLLKGEIPQPSKLSLLEDVFGKELIQETLSKRPALDKLKDLATEIINVPRSLMASFDMSAPFRQGIIFTVAKPKSAVKAGYEMFRQAFSEKNYAGWLDDIKKDSLYRVMKESDLYIADPRRVSGGLAAREERFMSNLAERIPVIGAGIRAAERAYTSYLNKLRVDVFSSVATKFQKMGLEPKENAELYKSLAGFVNNATGRGDLGKFNRISQQLNTLFFSPRLIASRFNMLNPAWYAKQPVQVRREAIKSFAEFVGVGTSVLTLAKLGGAEVELDPRSTDFGKIRIGNTRWDIWGGFQQWVRVFSQIASGERKTQKGEVIELSRKKFPFETRFDVAERFLRGKLAPIPGLALELFEGSKLYGEELKVTQEVAENITPLYLQDIKESFEQLGPWSMFTVGAPAFFGVGVQTYEEKKKGNRFNF